MSEARLPGDFIVDVANHGQELSSLLLLLFSSYEVRVVAVSIAASVTTLMDVGNEVNKNAQYFKENFRSKFESSLTTITEKYDIVRRACEKAASEKVSDSTDRTVNHSTRGFKKLMWAFGMTRSEFNQFSRSLRECYKPALLLRNIVNLVVLQIHGRQRELTPAEQTILFRCKSRIPKFLESLREHEIGPIVSFSLCNTLNLVNITQIVEAARPVNKPESNSDNLSEKTVIGTAADKSNGNVNFEETEKGIVTKDSQRIEIVTKPEKKDPIYEMYRISYRNSNSQVCRSSSSLFHISLKRERQEIQSVWCYDRLYTSQDDLIEFIEKQKQTNAKYEASKMKSLLNPPPYCSGSLDAIFSKKHSEPQSRHYKWSLECLISQSKKSEQSRWFRKAEVSRPDSYIVVICGESSRSYPPVTPQPHPRYPQPPGPFAQGRPVISVFPRISQTAKPPKRKDATEIRLTQNESEVVLNDFLASFSTLYDGVPVESRGLILRELELDNGYDSDDSDSTDSSGSLADD